VASEVAVAVASVIVEVVVASAVIAEAIAVAVVVEAIVVVVAALALEPRLPLRLTPDSQESTCQEARMISS